MDNEQFTFSQARNYIGKLVRLETDGWAGVNNYVYKENAAALGTVGIIEQDTGDYYTTLETLENGVILNRRVNNTKAVYTLVEDDTFLKEYKNAKARSKIYGTGYGPRLGSDPEVFAVDEKGVVIPAFQFLPAKGTGSTYWDGFQAEFNIATDYCLAYVVDYIQGGLKSVYDAAKKLNQNAKLSWASVVEIPYEVMKATKKEHYQLGCAPSHNSYPNTEPINVPNGKELPIRFAGCHIHFGYKAYYQKNMTEKAIIEAVKAMDAIAGVVSVALLENLEDTRRRKFYGKAGEFRLPNHGLEYRVPSSTVMAHPALTHLTFDLTRLAGSLSWAGIAQQVWETKGDEQVQDIINNYNVDEARALIKHNETTMKNLIRSLYTANRIKPLMAWITEGVRNHLPLESMEKNWFLNGGWTRHSESVGGCVTRTIKA